MGEKAFVLEIGFLIYCLDEPTVPDNEILLYETTDDFYTKKDIKEILYN